MAVSPVDVRITGDASDLSRATKRARRDLSGVEKDAKGVEDRVGRLGKSGGGIGGLTSAIGGLRGGLAGLGATAIVGGLAKLVQQVNMLAEAASTIRNRAAGVGIAVEEFQALTTVFSQFGLDADDVNDAFNEINVKLGDAAAGTASVKKAFEDLNIPIRDAEGNLRNNVDVWEDLQRAIAAGTTAEQVNAVDAILGGDLARRALPLLQQTEEQYRNLVDAAASAVTPAETLENLAEQHRDNILAAAERQADLNRIAEEFTPIVEAWNTLLGATIGLIADVVEGISDAFTPDGPSAFEQAVADVRSEIAKLAADGGPEFDSIRERLESLGRTAQVTGVAPLAQSFQDLLVEAQALAGVLPDVEEPTSRLQQLLEKGREDFKTWAEGAKEFNEELAKVDPPLTEVERLRGELAKLNAVYLDPEALRAKAEELNLSREIAAAKDREAAVVERLAAALRGEAEARRLASPDAFAGVEPVDLVTTVRPTYDPETAERLRETRGEAARLQQVLNDLAGGGNVTFNTLTDLAGGFTDALVKGTSAADNLLRSLLRLAANAAIGGLINVLAGGGFIAGAQAALGGTTSPATGRPFGRALGGPVQAGEPYLVGERGRELFVPQTSGRIVANQHLDKRGGTGNHYEINIHGRFDAITRGEVRTLIRTEALKVVTALESGRDPAVLARELGKEERQWRTSNSQT